MFIDKNSIIINGVSMGQYLTEVEFGYYKLWDDSSGRNLAGAMTGTLVGIFEKLILQFRRLTKEEMEIVSPILNTQRQTLTYYDPDFRRNNTIETYTGDFKFLNKNIINSQNKNEPFSCSFIATKKRS
jgi:hypothetical protein